MEEVDGMSGSDRGGIAELIKLINNSKIPIICVCNDANSPKLKSLMKHVLHLKFIRFLTFLFFSFLLLIDCII